MSENGQGGPPIGYLAEEEVVPRESVRRALAAEARLDPAALRGLTYGALRSRLQGRLESQRLEVQCWTGQVLQADPAGGAPSPVPFARVTLYAAEQGLVVWTPPAGQSRRVWSRVTHREVIAEVRTDAEGRFAMNLPACEQADLEASRRRFQPSAPAGEGREADPGTSGPLRRSPPPAGLELPSGFRFGAETDWELPTGRITLGPSPYQVPAGGADQEASEWQVLLAVPDRLWRVTQVLSDGGGEEVVLDEDLGSLPWLAPRSREVRLWTDARARAVPAGRGPTGVSPSEHPTWLAVGELALEATRHDACSGRALRVNRPSRGGLPPSPGLGPATGASPYLGTLTLYGDVHQPEATHYRVLRRVGRAWVPVTGVAWWAAGRPAGLVRFHPDGEGFYPVLPSSSLASPFLVMPYPTHGGLPEDHELVLQTVHAERGGRRRLVESAQLRLRSDPRAPEVRIEEVRWWPEPRGPGGAPARADRLLERVAGQALLVEFTCCVYSEEFRSVHVTFRGEEGGAQPELLHPREGLIRGRAVELWARGLEEIGHAAGWRYRFPPEARPGRYTFTLTAVSRAFRPVGVEASPEEDGFWNLAHCGATREVEVVLLER